MTGNAASFKLCMCKCEEKTPEASECSSSGTATADETDQCQDSCISQTLQGSACAGATYRAKEIWYDEHLQTETVYWRCNWRGRYLF